MVDIVGHLVIKDINTKNIEGKTMSVHCIPTHDI